MMRYAEATHGPSFLTRSFQVHSRRQSMCTSNWLRWGSKPKEEQTQHVSDPHNSSLDGLIHWRFIRSITLQQRDEDPDDYRMLLKKAKILPRILGNMLRSRGHQIANAALLVWFVKKPWRWTKKSLVRYLDFFIIFLFFFSILSIYK